MRKPMPDDARVVHAGVRFDLVEVAYPRLSGGAQRREVIVPADAVAIVPVLDDGQVVLIRNERFAVDQTLWEIPAGTVEPGEDLAACAARELVEETGYAAERVERLCEFYTTPGFCTELMTIFVAQGLRYEGQDLDETERIEAEPVAWDEAMSMVCDGRVRDGKTIAGLLHYGRFRRGDG